MNASTVPASSAGPHLRVALDRRSAHRLLTLLVGLACDEHRDVAERCELLSGAVALRNALRRQS